MDNVIWMSVADGSWGGCDSDDLIVVDSAEFTDEEWGALNEADNREAFDIISKVDARTKRTRI